MRRLADIRVLQIANGTNFVPSVGEAKQLASMVIELQRQLSEKVEAAEIETVHTFLPKVRHNQTEASRVLNANRGTVRKYLDDRNGKYHRIIDGVLFTAKRLQGDVDG